MRSPEWRVSWWWTELDHRADPPRRNTYTGVAVFTGPDAELCARREHTNRGRGTWAPADADEWGVDSIQRPT